MGYSLSYEKILELDGSIYPLCCGCSKCKGKAECDKLRSLETEISTVINKFNPYILSEEHTPKELKGRSCWTGATRILGKVDVALSKFCLGNCENCKMRAYTWFYGVCQKANTYNDIVYKLMIDFIEKTKG